jgi:cell division septation protein DedD
VLVAGSLPAPRRASAPAPARAIAAARPESRPVPAAAPTPRRPRGNWRVQLGAFGVESNADRLWAKLAPNPALSGTDKALVPAGRLTKLHAVGFASRAEASAACASLKREGQACLVTAPRS